MTDDPHAAPAQPPEPAVPRASLRDWELFGQAIPHELNSPVAIIASYSQHVLASCDTLPEKARYHLGRISATARHMQALLDGLLLFSPLTTQELRHAKVDLAALAADCIRGLRDVEPGRNVDVRLPASLLVEGDPGMLRLVMQNLVGNAWKFTRGKTDASIKLASRQEESRTVYCVSDNGIGFDMADASRLFAPFERLHGRDRFEGSGVGLAIVRRAIERHGGIVWAEAVPGEGAAFHFTLSGKAAPALSRG